MKAAMTGVIIVGAGAMGAIYAALLHDRDRQGVAFLAGGERGERLRRNGVVVNGKPYQISVCPPDAVPAPAHLVMMAVKHHQLEQAIRDLAQAVGTDTTMLSVMNGIDSEERLARCYGPEKVLYAIAVGMDAVRTGNRVNYRNQGKIVFGRGPNPVDGDRVQRVKELFDLAGIVSEVSADMLRHLWWKFMINVGINQASAVLRGTYGLFQTSPQARALMDAAMREVIELSRKAGVPLTEADLGRMHEVLETLNPDGKTSMLQDVEARQKTEVEMFAGKVVELGQRFGVPTPVNEQLLHQIKAIEASYLPGERATREHTP